MKRGSRYLAGLFASLTFTMSVTWVEAQPGKPATLEDVRQAWKARQDRIRSGRFVLQENLTDTKGSLNWLVAGPRKKTVDEARREKGLPPLTSDVVIPPRDSKLVVRHEVWFDGDRLRYATQGDDSFNLLSMSYVEKDNASTFDGKSVSKSIRLGGVKDAPEVFAGHIKEESRADDALIPSVRPITMTFRGLSPNLRAYDLERTKATGRQAVVGGTPCVELVVASMPGSIASTRLWVDPARECVICRIQTLRQEKVLQQLDIRYESDPVNGPIPIAWNVSTYNAESVLQRHQQVAVTSRDLNPQLPAKQFDLEFPPGAMVLDGIKHEMWIVRNDGGKRMLVGAERFMSYRELTDLIDREASTFGRVPWMSPVYFWTTVVGGIVISLALIGWRMGRRWHRQGLRSTAVDAAPGKPSV